MRLVTSLSASVALAATVMVNPASATTMFPQKFTCPIGGERFEDYVIGSSSSWGARPDGRTYGTLPVYPVVECPTNGFLLYDEDIPEAELRILEPLVEGADYQALRSTETPHYRVWWLMKAAGRPARERAGALLQASWETDEDPARKARYQESFVAEVRALPGGEGSGGRWLLFRLRAANALRELTRFDEAALLLDEAAQPSFLPTDPDERSGTERFIAGLRRLVADHNAVSEPTNLIPANQALPRCDEPAGALSPVEAEACSSPAIEEARKEKREGEARRNSADDASAPLTASEAVEEAERNAPKTRRRN